MTRSLLRRVPLQCLALTMLASTLLLASPLAHADAPAGRYTIVEDGTAVVDHKTGLTWRRQAGRKGNYASAISICKAPWRVPNTRELLSLVDLRAADPAIDDNAFPNTPSEKFWTSDRMINQSNGSITYHWVVDFSNGASVRQGSIQTNTMFVHRCVKSD